MADQKSWEITRDSAMIITAATILLYVWGYAYDAYSWSVSCVPSMFLPDIELHERTLQGGLLVLLVYFPLTLVVWLFDIIIKNRISRELKRIWQYGFMHQIVIVLLIFAFSIVLLKPAHLIIARNKPPLLVESVILSSDISCPVSKGMYCVGMRKDTYFFVAKRTTDPQTVYLLKKDEVVSLVLKRKQDDPSDEKNKWYSIFLFWEKGF
ncbi:hypothetical protein K8T06_03165 [bacterium]|nr:hypothetical protein [bacterium]